MEDITDQEIYEVRHVWNRMVYRATSFIPRILQKKVRKALFSKTPSNAVEPDFLTIDIVYPISK